MYFNIVNCLIESKVLGECSDLESRSAAAGLGHGVSPTLAFSIAGLDVVEKYLCFAEAMKPLCS